MASSLGQLSPGKEATCRPKKPKLGGDVIFQGSKGYVSLSWASKASWMLIPSYFWWLGAKMAIRLGNLRPREDATSRPKKGQMPMGIRFFGSSRGKLARLGHIHVYLLCFFLCFLVQLQGGSQFKVGLAWSGAGWKLPYLKHLGHAARGGHRTCLEANCAVTIAFTAFQRSFSTSNKNN